MKIRCQHTQFKVVDLELPQMPQGVTMLCEHCRERNGKQMEQALHNASICVTEEGDIQPCIHAGKRVSVPVRAPERVAHE